MRHKFQALDKRIGLMVFPYGEKYQGLILRFVDVLAPVVKELSLLTGNFQANLPYDNVNIVNVGTPTIKDTKESVISKAFRLLLVQFTLSKAVVQQSKKLDVIILYLSTGLLLLPILWARILSKKVVIIITGSGSQSLRAMYPSLIERFYSVIIGWIERLDYSLANRIVVDSDSVIANMRLKKHSNKISIAHEHFLDFDKFKVRKQLDKRQNLVGYIGRFSEEKGILNFIEAVPEIIKERGEVNFLVGGEGRLRDKIDKYLDEEDLTDKVKLPGWLPHNELPNYLNELKLLILPSFTEGLPNIILEAMACGTPVLATPVGSVPEVIKDGETGFIMRDNSPKSIAKNVIRAFNHPDLEEIAQNAHILVEREYTYETAVERYRQILGNFLK